MKTLPPIPMNCPYFVNAIGTVWFELHKEFGSSEVRCLNTNTLATCTLTASERLIIASVARCAWMDEEMRKEALLRLKKAPYPLGWNTVPEWNSRNEARNNAEQWRKWGLNEN